MAPHPQQPLRGQLQPTHSAQPHHGPLADGGASLLEVGAARGPWDVSTGDAANIGLRAEQEAHEALKQSHAAASSRASAHKIANKNKNIMPTLLSSVESSVTSARNAYAAQTFMEDLAQQVKEATQAKANEVMEAAVDAVREEALDAAHVEAEKRGKALMAKMIASAGEAAEKAAEPYAEAEARAADIADKYEAMGDAKVGKSSSAQMDAQTLLGQAQAWQRLGELGKAQTMFRDSHKLMEKAVGYNAQANAFYNAAQTILSHESEYKNEAKMAEYHAMMLHDPDAEPP